MEQVRIGAPEGLIEVDIRPRIETYFLVTEDHLKSITGKNILTDVFSLIASLLWGAYVSVVIAITASIKVPLETMTALQTYQKVFLVCAIAFTILAVVFLFITYKGISGIRRSSLSDSKITAMVEGNKDEGPVEKVD